MKIRIEGGGHCVEVEQFDMPVEAVAKLAEELYSRTKVDLPRQQIGYGSQLVERTVDRPVAGGGVYEVKPDPATAHGRSM